MKTPHAPISLVVNRIAVLDCPEDVVERAELYCLKRLPAPEERQFEAHVTVCPACQVEVFDTEVFLETLVAALGERQGCLAS